MLSFFPRDVLDEIWDLIELVSEGFPTYSFRKKETVFVLVLLIWGQLLKERIRSPPGNDFP